MRRKDREVTDNSRINEIIKKCSCCRIGLNDDGKIYIVPLSFGFEEKDGKRTFYFHSASEGRKIDLIGKNEYAAFELDTSYELMPAEKACGYSAKFQSVIGTGKISFIEETEEQLYALQAIMEQSTGKRDWEFMEGILKKMAIFKIEVEEISCKENQ